MRAVKVILKFISLALLSKLAGLILFKVRFFQNVVFVHKTAMQMFKNKKGEIGGPWSLVLKMKLPWKLIFSMFPCV